MIFRQKSVYLFVFAWLLAFAGMVAVADEGRRPLPRVRAVTYPIVLSSPGQYILVQDLVAPSGVVLQINGDDISIDLNGFRVETPSGAAAVTGTGLDNIVIRNGKIIGGTENIRIDQSNRVVLEDLELSGAARAVGLEDADNFAIRRLNIDARQTGIEVFTSSGSPPYPHTGVVEGNVVEIDGPINPFSWGIRVSGASGAAMRNNRVRGGGIASGIRMQACDGCSVTDNTLAHTESGIEAIYATGCRIVGNSIAFPSVDGISVSTGTSSCVVDNNAIHAPTFYGIRVAGGDDHLLRNNTVTGGAIEGIAVSSMRNYLEGNLTP
jgi:hypothetical protein